MIKEPIWTWEIPFYFFTGGLGGRLGRPGLPGRAARQRGAGAAGVGGRAGRRYGQPGASDLRSGAAAALSEHAADVQGHLADERRLLDPVGQRRQPPTVAAANAWTGSFPRLSRVARPAAALLGLRSRTYTGALSPTLRCPPGTRRGGCCRSCSARAPRSAPAPRRSIAHPDRAAPRRRAGWRWPGRCWRPASSETMEKQLGELGEPYKQGSGGTLRAPRPRLHRLGRGAAGRPRAAARGPPPCSAGALLSGRCAQRPLERVQGRL